MLLSNALVGVLAVLISTTCAAWLDARTPAAPAVDDLAPDVAPRAWTGIVLHHSATAQGSVAAIDAEHRRRKDAAGNPWLGIGYHFVVGNGRDMSDGEVRPTFRWQRQLAGAHAGGPEQNEHAIGICLIGNFEVAAPSARQIAAVCDLVKALVARYDIPRQRVLRHQDVGATLCPGRLFPWQQVLSGLPEDKGT